MEACKNYGVTFLGDKETENAQIFSKLLWTKPPSSPTSESAKSSGKQVLYYFGILLRFLFSYTNSFFSWSDIEADKNLKNTLQ